MSSLPPVMHARQHVQLLLALRTSTLHHMPCEMIPVSRGIMSHARTQTQRAADLALASRLALHRLFQNFRVTELEGLTAGAGPRDSSPLGPMPEYAILTASGVGIDTDPK